MASAPTQASFAERHGANVLLLMGIVVFAFGGVTFVTDSKALGAGLWIVAMVAVAVATRMPQMTELDVDGESLGFAARAHVAFRRCDAGAQSASRPGTSVTRSLVA
jgi:hypothetical protein